MKITIPPHNGQAVTESQRQALLTAARTYLGTPWQHLGRNAYGLDCAGAIILPIYDVLNAWVEVGDYSPWPNMQTMREICNRILLPIKREDMQPGDVALLYAPGVGVVHLGWFAGQTLIHANNERHAQKVVETSIHPDWNWRGAFAVPQFSNQQSAVSRQQTENRKPKTENRSAATCKP